MKKIVFVFAWLACSYLNWGLTLGYFTHRFPQYDETFPAALLALAGPFGLPTTIILSIPNHHWLVKPYTTEQQWEAYHREYSDLPREEFDKDH